MNIVIATVCLDKPIPEYAMSLYNTLTSINDLIDSAPGYIQVNHQYFPNARESAAKNALRANPKASGILWIDSDMAWAPEDYFEMLKLAKKHKRAVIGFGYPARKTEVCVPPLTSPATKVGRGLFKVDHVGFGFTYTPMALFRRPEPWFNVEWNKKEQGFNGEDVWFFWHLPKGWKVLVYWDHTVKHAFEPGVRGMR